MYVFTFVFWSTIFFLTITQHRWLAISLAIWVWSLFLRIPQTKNWHRLKANTLRVISAIFIACIAVSLKEYLYFHHGQTHQINPQEPYIGTGLIIKHVMDTRFIIKIEGKEYFYHSDQDYSPGMVLRTTATIKPWLQKSSLLYPQQTFNQAWSQTISKLMSWTFDYERWLVMKWIYGDIYEENAIIQETTKWSIIASIRQKLLKNIQSIYTDSHVAWLISWMLIGDRSLMSQEQYQSFIESGLVHIIAVSGGNMVMLTAFLALLLFRLPFYCRTTLLLMAIIAYTGLVWNDSSVIRAMIMGVLTYVALLTGRIVSVSRLMCYAFILMLLINPYFLISDIWFIFSFAALSGIILMARHWNTTYRRSKYLPWWQRCRLYCKTYYLIPSLGASLGVFPFLLFFSQSFNILSLFANLIVVPLVPLTMIYGGLTGMFASQRQRPRMEKVGSALVHYIQRVSDSTSDFGIYLEIHHQWYATLILIVFLMIYLILRQGTDTSHI